MGLLIIGWIALLVFFVFEKDLAWYYAILIGISPAFLSAAVDLSSGEDGEWALGIVFLLLIASIPLACVQFFSLDIYDQYNFWQKLAFSVSVIPACAVIVLMNPVIGANFTDELNSYLNALNMALFFLISAQAVVYVRFGVLGIPDVLPYQNVPSQWWAVCLVLLAFPVIQFCIPLLLIAVDHFVISGEQSNSSRPKATSQLSPDVKDRIDEYLNEQINELRIFVAFARSDGRMDQEEREIIINFLFSDADLEITRDDLHDYVKRTKVSKNQLSKAIDKLMIEKDRLAKAKNCARELRKKDKSKDGTFDDLWARLNREAN